MLKVVNLQTLRQNCYGHRQTCYNVLIPTEHPYNFAIFTFALGCLCFWNVVITALQAEFECRCFPVTLQSHQVQPVQRGFQSS